MKKIKKWIDKKMVDPFFDYCDQDEIKHKGVIRVAVDPKFYSEVKKRIINDKDELRLMRKVCPHKEYYGSWADFSRTMLKKGLFDEKR